MLASLSDRQRTFLLTSLYACGILFLYNVASFLGNWAQLVVHAILIASVWRFRNLLPTPAKKPATVTLQTILLFVLAWVCILIFINVLPVVEYVSDPSGMGRLLKNLPLIVRVLLPLAAELLFVWFIVRRFKISRESLGLGSVRSAGAMGGFLILLAFPLVGFLLSMNDVAALLLLGPKEQLALSLDGLIGIGAAFAEEMLFRGAFFALLLTRLSPFHAWIAQAVLFGLSHVFVSNPIGAMGPGLVFGLSILLTRSLLPGVVAHVLMNMLGQIQAATFTQ